MDVAVACVGAEEAICDVALVVVLALAALTLDTGIFCPFLGWSVTSIRHSLTPAGGSQREADSFRIVAIMVTRS